MTDSPADRTAPEPGDWETCWLFDVNVLVALTLSTHVHHRAAHAALQRHAGPWATTPVTESALIKLLLNPSVTGRPFSPAEVVSTVRGLRRDPRWRWLADDTSLSAPLIETAVLTGHQQVSDLHLVNLAAHHRAVLATFDAAIPTCLAPADRRHVTVLGQ